MIKLHIHPGKASNIVSLKKNYAMTLDGYIPQAPYHDPILKLINFNHHEGVDRLSTRATCSQVLIAIRQGMMELFRNDGEIELDVYVNDCDQDVCLSWFLLKNHHLVVNSMNPLINRLVHIEDMMDTCGGTYPFHRDTPVLKEIAWIFEPYTLFRLSGGLDRKNQAEYRNVIDSVCSRIMNHITGNSQEIDLEIDYEVTHRAKNFCMIQERGRDDRMDYWGAGIKAFVAFREKNDGNYVYTIAKMSPFIKFDIEAILEKLKELEPGWGGSSIIGGSPRGTGSKFKPEELIKIIEGVE
jgi:hypothetical protein